MLLTATCLTTPGHPAHSLSPLYGSWPALGAGPVYPVVSVVGASVKFAPHGAMYFQKVLWIVSPRDPHQVTITLTGSTRFATTTSLGGFEITGKTIRIEAGRGWRAVPTEVAVRDAGCITVRPSIGRPIMIRAVV
jgi:hypothetical protein